MSVKERKKSSGLIEGEDPSSEKVSEENERVAEKNKKKEAKRKPRSRRQPSKRFAKDRANTVGKEQGAKYLTLALLGLFVPPLAPAAWLLTQSLHAFARTHAFLLDNRIYAAWVLGLVSTIFYSCLLLLIALQYLLVPGYSFSF